LQAALQTAASLESAEVMVEIYREAALTYETRGDFAQALQYERKLAAATEQMRGEEDRRRMSELTARYGAEQRELASTLLKREQELQNAEIRRRRSRSLALGVGLVGGVLVLGAVILFQRYRLRAERRMREVTEAARERAEAAERLKSRLLQIASHDMKVP